MESVIAIVTVLLLFSLDSVSNQGRDKIISNSKQVSNQSIIGSCKIDADCDDKFPCCSRFEQIFLSV